MQREPFVNVTITEDGEEVFQGFCIDMMDKLSELMGFSYRISLVEDGKFGGQAEDGTWMGLVGDLVAHVSNSEMSIMATCDMYHMYFRKLKLP